MKFGKRLARQCHPEWVTFYIDYRHLKQELKQAYLFGDVDGVIFQNKLKAELVKVNSFFLEKECYLVKHFAEFEDDSFLRSPHGVHIFQEFCRVLEVLRYYVVLNYIAIYKITKKRNKMLNQSTKTIDFLSILLEQPFYNSTKLARITVKTELVALQFLPNAQVEEASFTCPICLDVLCSPVVLSCTHRFCWTCLSKTSESIQACPVCRKDQYLDPTNFQIDWILKEFLKQRFPESQSKEPQLPTKPHTGLIKKLEARASNLTKYSDTSSGKKGKGKVEPCKYTLTKKIGEGVFGEIFLAQTKHSAQDFALKKLSKNHPKFKKSSVLREIQAGSKLEHPNIVRFVESFETSSSVYLVMEYFESKDLYTIMEERSFTPYIENDAKFICDQLLQALCHSHSKGVAHRDIKLENILMGESGSIKVIDFGLSEPKVYDSNGSLRLSNEYLGSPAYIAPEILQRKLYDSLKADSWSTGVVLFALLFGKFPFSPNQYKDLVNGSQIVLQFPDMAVSGEIKEILSNLLETDPKKRSYISQVYEKFCCIYKSQKNVTKQVDRMKVLDMIEEDKFHLEEMVI